MVTADLAWVLVSVVIGFPSRLETIFQTLVAALTLALVFVIQHTLAREQVVVERKLDEVLKALPKADRRSSRSRRVRMPSSRPPIRRIEACARRRWTSLYSAPMEVLLEVRRGRQHSVRAGT